MKCGTSRLYTKLYLSVLATSAGMEYQPNDILFWNNIDISRTTCRCTAVIPID